MLNLYFFYFSSLNSFLYMYFLQIFKICRADHSINFSFTHLKFVKNITKFDLYFLLFAFQDTFLRFIILSQKASCFSFPLKSLLIICRYSITVSDDAESRLPVDFCKFFYHIFYFRNINFQYFCNLFD